MEAVGLSSLFLTLLFCPSRPQAGSCKDSGCEEGGEGNLACYKGNLARVLLRAGAFFAELPADSPHLPCQAVLQWLCSARCCARGAQCVLQRRVARINLAANGF